MAKNFVQDGVNLTLVESTLVHVDSSGVADGLANGGDAVVQGTITGVALVDASATTDLIAVATEGVFSLPVQGVNGSGNVAVASGDKVYIDPSTGVLSKIATGVLFGKALGAVASGNTTTTIDVRLIQA